MLLLSSVDEYLKRESRVVGEIVKWREYIYTSWITVHKIATQMCVKQFRDQSILSYCTVDAEGHPSLMCVNLLLRITGLLAIAN